MNFNDVYNELKNLLEKNDFSVFGSGLYSYEFDITGDGEGKFYLEIRDGIAHIEPYDYRNSTCSIQVSSRHIRKLFERTLTPTAAYSTGRLKVSGDISAAFRLADVIGLNI